MVLYSLNARLASALRAFGLVLIAWTVIGSKPAPGTGSARAVLIGVLLALGAIAWIAWTWQTHHHDITAWPLFALAAIGGLLIGTAPQAAGSAFAFVAIVTAGFRLEVSLATAVAVLGTFTMALGVLIYDRSAVNVLVYVLAFTAAFLAGANARQVSRRAEEAELLLAQAQRSREEQLRAARLEESARIAREIHDVLAHALAGLTIQLEATSALVQKGADTAEVLERIQRAHALAREGLEETRRAVGVLRGEGLPVADALEALLAGYRAASPHATAEMTIQGTPDGLEGPVALAVVRVAQEALTNVNKHAAGASVQLHLAIPSTPDDSACLTIRNGAQPTAGHAPQVDGLATTGGGYGLRGMRERAQMLGGSLTAGPNEGGWLVELDLPIAQRPDPPEPPDPQQ